MSFTPGSEATPVTSTVFGPDLSIVVPDSTWTIGKLVVIKFSQRGTVISSITDPRGNTWTLKNSVGSNADDGGISPCFAYCVLTNSYTSGDSITVTGTGNGARSASARVYAANSTIVFDQFVEGVTNQTFGTAMNAGTVTTPSPALVICAYGIDTNQSTLTPVTGGFTAETGISNGSSRGILSMQKAQSAAGTETTPQATAGSATGSMGATITFIESGTTNPKTLTATGSQTATVGRQDAKPFAATQAETATAKRVVSKVLVP